MRWGEKENNHILTLEDDDYPFLLKEIPDPPILLYVKGNLEAVHAAQIAIVGTRQPSETGKYTAEEFAKELSHYGMVITSGLALGIDSYAHHGALLSDAPTIAVVGTGVDIVYPKQNTKLAEKILAKKGAIVSEFALIIAPKAENFPRRNRIISGLSLGVLVVEAAKQSGSLITAKMAMEQGREVFAVPGSIYNPLTHGCHDLIRQGAKLVENTRDILEEISDTLLDNTAQHRVSAPKNTINNTESLEHTGINPSFSSGIHSIISNALKNMSPEQKAVFEQVTTEGTTVDYIVEVTGLAIEVVSSHLFMLELEGFITSSTDGSYLRLPEYKSL